MIKAYRYDSVSYRKQWEANILEFYATFPVRLGIELAELSQKNKWMRTFPEHRQAQLMETLICECPKSVAKAARKDIEDYLLPDKAPFWVPIDPSELPKEREYLVCENGEMTELYVRKLSINQKHSEHTRDYPTGE